jgi:hypothetical protein
MDRAKLRELQEKYKKEVREGITIEDFKAGSYTRLVAETLENAVPGRGVELTLRLCEQPDLAGCSRYLQVSGYEMPSKLRWIRQSGLSIEDLRAITGHVESYLRQIMDTQDADQPKDSRQMRLF